MWYRRVVLLNRKAQTRTCTRSEIHLKPSVCLSVHVPRCTALCIVQHQILSHRNWKSELKKKVKKPETLHDADVSPACELHCSVLSATLPNQYSEDLQYVLPLPATCFTTNECSPFSKAKQDQYLAFDFPNANNPKFNTVNFSTPAQNWKQEEILK